MFSACIKKIEEYLEKFLSKWNCVEKCIKFDLYAWNNGSARSSLGVLLKQSVLK